MASPRSSSVPFSQSRSTGALACEVRPVRCSARVARGGRGARSSTVSRHQRPPDAITVAKRDGAGSTSEAQSTTSSVAAPVFRIETDPVSMSVA